jgi:hypothetical protein
LSLAEHVARGGATPMKREEVSKAKQPAKEISGNFSQ